MRLVYQSIVDPDYGDCERACIATLFDLELEDVPNFILFGRDWGLEYQRFLNSIGYVFQGSAGLQRHKDTINKVGDYLNGFYESVNGYYKVSVPSKTFPGQTHAVIIDESGLVVHDPNPNEAWKGINVDRKRVSCC